MLLDMDLEALSKRAFQDDVDSEDEDYGYDDEDEEADEDESLDTPAPKRNACPTGSSVPKAQRARLANKRTLLLQCCGR